MNRAGFRIVAVVVFIGLVALALTGRLVSRALAQSERRQIFRQRILQQRRGGTAAPESLNIAGLSVSVWKLGGTSVNHAPLVIFSHGFSGSSTQSSFLMKALAEHGYFVMAVDHRDSSRSMKGGFALQKPAAPFGNPGAWSDATYRDRANDIITLLQAIKTDPALAVLIDTSRIAIAGHSLGGYTALGLAGAWPKWKQPDIKAVLALSPFCSPYVEKGSLGTMSVPVMYQGGTRDLGVTPFVSKKGGAFDKTAGPTYFVEFEKAGHFAWTDLNPQFHASISSYSIAFLDKYLKGNSGADLEHKRSDVSILRSK